ncbi:RNA polymerase subunit sigma-70 [Nonlabens dokdonensis]|uniref:RNA polymerase subunit sigma-70 n=1 Tax=Nonlabens dokdonensis TaxID=328515 RepID=A0A1Z8BF77_9FLAO|nr:RNA polymerase sigma factor [Nonlabens dokdonensis]OUS21224.1 RNA polymerase subunit sigma-70 [Nonlabens dokdonensis]
MKNTPDEEILSLILDDATANQGFRLLVSQNQEQLYWQIRKLVLVHDDADDVLQNVFIKIFKGIKNFNGKSKLSTWMFRIAYNESMTFLKKKARNLQLSSQELQEHLTEKLEADVYFTGDEIELALQKALLELPDRQREVFNLRYYDDLKFKEIAEILDLTEGAVKSTYHIAAKKVEHFLKDH